MMKRLFKGGTVVSGEGLKKIDLLVKGEKILAAGKNLEFQDAETIDVRGKLLFPGFIDAHTHMAAKFNDITAADKFETGTKAALAGGTTCIIDFAEQKKGKSLKEAIDDKRQEAEGEASCDYALHLTPKRSGSRSGGAHPEDCQMCGCSGDHCEFKYGCRIPGDFKSERNRSDRLCRDVSGISSSE